MEADTALAAIVDRLVKLEAVADAARALAKAEESKTVTATHWLWVYRSLRALDGE